MKSGVYHSPTPASVLFHSMGAVCQGKYSIGSSVPRYRKNM